MRVRLLLSIAAWSLVGLSSFAVAAPLTVSHNNSRITVDPESVFGFSSWMVDDEEHMFEQWSWLREGDDPFEVSLDTLALAVQESIGNQIHLRYSGADLDVDLLYTLFGGAAGSGQSDVAERILLTNRGTSPMTLSWFQEIDFDLNGTSDGDLAFGGIAGLTQTEGGTFAFVRASPTPTAFQIAGFPLLFASLTDNAITTLDNTGSPTGPGDVSSALQWNLTLAPGQTATIDVTKTIVPEPASLLLVGVGLAGLAAYVRRRRTSTREPSLSRRTVVRNLATLGGAGLVLPTVTRVVRPAAAAAPFRDIVLDNEIVFLRFDAAVLEPFTISGFVDVTPEGVMNGSGTVTLSDGTVAFVTISNDDVEIAYRDVTLNLMTETNDLARINGVLVPSASVLDMFRSEQNFTGIGPLSDLSRASVVAAAFASTPQFLRNAKVARKAAIRGGWCKFLVWLAVTAIVAAGVLVVAALCGLGGTVTFGGLTVACAAVLVGGALVGTAVLEVVFLAAWTP